jgi:hypothetical protein
MAEYISDRAGADFHSDDYRKNNLDGKSVESLADYKHRTGLPSPDRSHWNNTSAPWRKGEFYKCLPAEAMSEFETMGTVFCCPVTTVLFTEEQQPSNVLSLLEGRVKLSMNSSGGKRLILGISGPGNILGTLKVHRACAAARK